MIRLVNKINLLSLSLSIFIILSQLPYAKAQNEPKPPNLEEFREYFIKYAPLTIHQIKLREESDKSKKVLRILLQIDAKVIRDLNTLSSTSYALRRLATELNRKKRFYFDILRLHFFDSSTKLSSVENLNHGPRMIFYIGINHLLDPKTAGINCDNAYDGFKGNRNSIVEVRKYAYPLFDSGPYENLACIYWDLFQKMDWLNDKKGFRTQCLVYVAMSYNQGGYNLPSIILSQQAELIAWVYNEPFMRAWALHNYGKSLINAGQNHLAVEPLKDSLLYSRQAGKLHFHGKTLHHLANAQWELGNIQEARQVYEESIKTKIENEEFKFLPHTIYGWAENEVAGKNYDFALDLINRIEKHYEKFSQARDNFDISIFWEAQILKAQIYGDKGDFNHAFKTLESLISSTSNGKNPNLHYRSLVLMVRYAEIVDPNLYKKYKTQLETSYPKDE